MSTIVGWIVPAILGWLAKEFHLWLVDYQARKAAEAKTSAAAAAVDAAKTPQEREDAAKQVSNNW